MSIHDIAREKLDVLLSTLFGRRFEASETDKAREAVRTINSLANLLHLELRFHSQPIILQCAYGSRRSSPGFQLRERSPTHKTILTSFEFPKLSTGAPQD